MLLYACVHQTYEKERKEGGAVGRYTLHTHNNTTYNTENNGLKKESIMRIT